MADINMEKNKLKHDDPTDLRDQQSIGLYITQKQDDAVSSEKMAPGSKASTPMNQAMKFDVVDDLKKSKPYSSEDLFIDNENAQGLNWTADIDGRF